MKIDAVISLMQMGFAVFPILDGSKKAAIKDWPNRATRDPKQAIKWWTQNPDRNIGVLTEKYWPKRIEHHMVVIDQDVTKGKRGISEWERIVCEQGEVPETLTATTATGGRHLFFTVPEPVRSGVDVLAPGIDIRSTGGYVVGAGSEINGNQYRFVDPSADVAPCPDWLLGLLPKAGEFQSSEASSQVLVNIDPQRATRRALSYLATAQPATEGEGGDVATYRVAAKLKDVGCTEALALELLLEHWNPRCCPPWSADELADKVKHAYKYGKNPVGSDAPEAVFDPVADPLAEAESWGADEIESNTEHLLHLRRSNPSRLDELAEHWDELALIDPEQLCSTLDEAAALNAGLDVEEIRQEATALSRPSNQKGLALLKTRDSEIFERIRSNLIDEGIEERQSARAISAGERILRAEAVARARNADGRTLVQFNPGNAVAVVDAIEEAILKDTLSEPVFSFASSFVTVRQSKPVTVRELGGSEYPPMTLVRRYDPPSLAERIARSVRLESTDREGNPRSIAIPESIVRALLSRNGGNAPPLTGIIEAPIVRRDGSVIDREGYDSETGLFVVFNGAKFPSVPEIPTTEQAQEARVFLEDELFSEFPFSDAMDRTAAVAALITGLIRPGLCDTAPGFLLSSPTQGTGKTALAQAICHGAYGRPPAATSWPSNDEEMSKFLTATLKEGQRAIVFDNIRDGSIVNSAQLATAMTSDNFTARILGRSETVTVPTAVLWLLTGNNVRLAGDMPSRVMEIYLDANDERPDRRTFRRDLVQWVAENRPRIVQAAIMIVRCYFANGCPALGGKATRFKNWDRMVRLPLIYAGGQDIGAKFDNAYQDDPILSAWRDVLHNWHASFGMEAITISQLLDSFDRPSAPFESPLPKLEESLKALLDERKGGKMTANSLGRIVGQFANRPAGGMRLRKGLEPRTKTNTWAIELCG